MDRPKSPVRVIRGVGRAIPSPSGEPAVGEIVDWPAALSTGAPRWYGSCQFADGFGAKASTGGSYPL